MSIDLFNTEDCDDSSAMVHAVEHETDRRGLLSGLGFVAASALCVRPAGASGADDELISLGSLLDAAWLEQTALEDAGADIQEPFDRAHQLAKQIEQIPATTLAGVIVKARACSWCHAGEPFEPDFFNEHPTTDTRLVASVFRDLIKISGKSVPRPAL